MRRCGAILVAAVLALVGCKGTTPKPDKDREPSGIAANRTKPKNPDPKAVPEWLDPTARLPGAGLPIPKGDSWTDPRDPNFNAAGEVKGVLAGRVIDAAGAGAKNVYIQLEPADGPGNGGAPVGISTDAAGYFMTKGLKPNTAYNLTAKATLDGKPLVAVIQARTPNVTLSLVLRDDLPTVPGGAPIPAPASPVPGVAPPTRGDPIPPPSGDLIPPMSYGPSPVPSPTKPPEGGWSPGGGAARQPLPPSIGSPEPPPGPPPVPALPGDPSVPTPKPTRPENVADGPQPWKPPVANIPGSALPPTPPPVPPIPPPAGGAPGMGTSNPKKTSALGPPVGNLALLDALERPWNLASSRSGPLVLLDFMTTSCPPCKRAIPTLVDLQARYGADGLQVVGVVCDEDVPQKERAARAAKYQRDNNLNYLLYVEPGAEPGSVRDRLNVSSYPTAILLDASGRVLWRGQPAQPTTNRDALEAAIRQALGR